MSDPERLRPGGDAADRDGARGGDFDPENNQTLCRGCHIDKTAGENATPEPEDIRG